MPIAIFDPFSGVAGDMTLGALIDLGLDEAWLRALPARMGLDGVDVRIQDVRRGEIACKKVDFDIPPQPHGRHITEIRRLVAASGAPDAVRRRADATFTAIAEAESAIHGVGVEEVHLHEVGAVDAILDVVGCVWGLDELGVTAVYCGTITMGDGFVRAAHGVLPVPAPATLRLLEGLPVRPGPEGAGELVTPTGAALVRALSLGPPPARYVPRRTGYGAGTKDPHGRANALRITLADEGPAELDCIEVTSLLQIAADVDDMTPEYLADAAEAVRSAGALDVVLVPVMMKKGRPGTRIEALTTLEVASRVEEEIFRRTTTLGVRRVAVERRALRREVRSVRVLERDIRVKIATLPDGSRRLKPEFDDVRAVAASTGRPAHEVSVLAAAAAERE